MFAAARDALFHVCEVVLRILHLDRLLLIGPDESAKSSSSPNTASPPDTASSPSTAMPPSTASPPNSDASNKGDRGGDDTGQEPKWTMTIETLSPRAFASKISTSAAEPSTSLNDISADSSVQVIQADGGADADKEDEDVNEPLAEDNAVPPIIQADKEKQQTPTTTAVSADRTPEAQSLSDVAATTKEARARQTADEPEIEKLDRTKGERDLLAWSSAPADAAGGASKSANDFTHTSAEKRTNEDLELASIESNATDDTEEDRMRALYENPVQVAKTKARAASRKPDPVDWSSSDDEEELKSALYASSPRCVPTLVRTSFTSI